MGGSWEGGSGAGGAAAAHSSRTADSNSKGRVFADTVLAVAKETFVVMSRGLETYVTGSVRKMNTTEINGCCKRNGCPPARCTDDLKRVGQRVNEDGVFCAPFQFPL